MTSDLSASRAIPFWQNQVWRATRHDCKAEHSPEGAAMNVLLQSHNVWVKKSNIQVGVSLHSSEYQYSSSHCYASVTKCVRNLPTVATWQHRPRSIRRCGGRRRACEMPQETKSKLRLWDWKRNTSGKLCRMVTYIIALADRLSVCIRPWLHVK